MTEQSLKQKTARGMAWNFAEKIIIYGMQFVVSLFIARILNPSDYGLIGMLAIFLAISNLFIDSGFSRSLIQKKDRTEVDYSTVFYFNLLISSAFYLLLFFGAPLIADFYNEPQLVLITRVLSLTFVIQSFTIVQFTKMAVQMDFKTRAIIQTIAVLISSVTGLLLAIYGFGVWALVGQNLAKTTATLLLLVIIKRWKPLLVFSKESFRTLFAYGSKLLLADICYVIVGNLYNILIGKFFAKSELGYYAKGNVLTNVMYQSTTDVLQNVTFPVMSDLQNDDERLRHVYRQLVKFSFFVIFPVMVGFALLSAPFVHLCLGAKWLPAVPIIQAICMSRLFAPVSALSSNFLKAKGFSGLILRLTLIKMPIYLGLLFLFLPYGVVAVAVGQAIAAFLAFLIDAYYPGKMVGYGALRQLRDMLPTALATFVMALVVFAVVYFVPFNALKIVCGIAAGAGVYFVICKLLKMKELDEVVRIIRKRIVRRA